MPPAVQRAPKHDAMMVTKDWANHLDMAHFIQEYGNLHFRELSKRQSQDAIFPTSSKEQMVFTISSCAVMYLLSFSKNMQLLLQGKKNGQMVSLVLPLW
jgi:hypothetical protein